MSAVGAIVCIGATGSNFAIDPGGNCEVCDIQTLADFEPKEMQKPGLKPGFLHFGDSVIGPAVRLLVQADKPRFEGVLLPGRSPEDRRLAAVYGRPSTRSG